jgi:hypothetical protein
VNKIVITNLLHSPFRTLITVSSVAISTAVVSTVVGIATLPPENLQGGKAIAAVFAAICFSSIFVATYSAVSPQTRQIAVMRALGACRLFLARAVIGEMSLVVCLGVGLGAGVYVAAVHLSRSIYPSMAISRSEIFVVSLVAVVAGVGGALTRMLHILSKFATFLKK